MTTKIPIIFSKHYDITLFGIEKLHPFDTAKYGKVYKHLRKHLGFKKQNFYTPKIVSEEELQLVHSAEYLASLSSSKNVAAIAEVGPLAMVPNMLLQSRLLKPMKYATGGTILGGELAMKYGWAVNLSGGYHHAKANSGEGFCFFSDIPIVIRKLQMQQPQLKVLIIDLDAHQGNGFEAVLQDDPRICTLDIYNGEIYPVDTAAMKYIDFNYPLSSYVKDGDYLSLLREGLQKCDSFKADLIIYNAGTDIYEKDQLGDMSVSAEGILERDNLVFSYATKNKIPILMLLSGGYSRESANIIGRSLVQIYKNHLQ
ncbi:histone deacetylase family protein [Candidatus Uabimicrobium amorphum]|uniref:Histone deacetylase n=1 Tax=Uabimicrobium amorphum TaxID=2596890 RepID=A0A5S9IRZ8_UABAM|nr:histone deacetylase [Candidatus Uabimicrobium amorphum]BBM86834.1 histone deacetylase [Candidatus Uabimicrobium amorphum]